MRHLDDPRARDVVRIAAERFDWRARSSSSGGRGRGFAFARYKNLAALCAVAVEVEVDRDSGAVRLVRAVAAVDSGDAVNPDGIRNQIEGGIVQAASWTLFEAVTFDAAQITSRDWSVYPILRFHACPNASRCTSSTAPAQPFLGTGEAAAGADRGGDRQRGRRRDRCAYARASLDAPAGEGRDRGVKRRFALRRASAVSSTAMALHHSRRTGEPTFGPDRFKRFWKD